MKAAYGYDLRRAAKREEAEPARNLTGVSVKNKSLRNNRFTNRVVLYEVTMDVRESAVSLSELVRLHYALLYRYAFRLSGSAEEAEDLTQQTFLLAHRRLGQLREPGSAKSWLCTILRNTFLTRACAKRGPRTVPLLAVAEPAEESLDEAILDPAELQQVLNELPEEFRTPLILFYFDEFSYREIADQMDVPIGTVMSRLARAKSYLRRRLEAMQSAEAR